MKRLLIDCSSGISGDMFLGALSGLGCDFSILEQAIREAGINVSIGLKKISRAGGPGRLMNIDWPEAQPMRHLSDLTDIVKKVAVSEEVREKATRMFVRLAEAEAEAHDAPIEEVHFHEVGAVDTLVDVLGAVWGLNQLGVDQVVCGPIPWFGGFVDCEHGRLPLPAPATLALLKGKPVFQSGAREELITPTGALLLDTLVDSFAPAEADDCSAQNMPTAVFLKSGLGYGSREPNEHSDWPSRGLRLHLYDLPGSKSDAFITDEVYVLATNLDHLTGEELGQAINQLVQAGALDVLWTPGLTKKNRPSGELSVMCRPEQLGEIQAAVFRHTHTLGLRLSKQTRITLPRGEARLDVGGSSLQAKEYVIEGKTYCKAEFEALAEEAARLGLGLPALRVKSVE